MKLTPFFGSLVCAVGVYYYGTQQVAKEEAAKVDTSEPEKTILPKQTEQNPAIVELAP